MQYFVIINILFGGFTGVIETKIPVENKEQCHFIVVKMMENLSIGKKITIKRNGEIFDYENYTVICKEERV